MRVNVWPGYIARFELMSLQQNTFLVYTWFELLYFKIYSIML